METSARSRTELTGPLKLITSPVPDAELEIVDTGDSAVVRKVPRDQLAGMQKLVEAANCGLGHHAWSDWQPMTDPVYRSRKIRRCEREFCSAKQHQMT